MNELYYAVAFGSIPVLVLIAALVGVLPGLVQLDRGERWAIRIAQALCILAAVLFAVSITVKP